MSRDRSAPAALLMATVTALLVAGYLATQARHAKHSGIEHTAPAIEQPQATTQAPQQQATPAPAGSQPWRPMMRTGLPLKVLDKRWYTVGYDEARKNPAWVEYTLTGGISHPGPEPTRPATFSTDFDTAAHVSHHDYTNSDYDRGHMCPAYAMWSRSGADAFMATFTCSNIIPQPHSVNAGIWEELETEIAGRSSSHGGTPAGGGWTGAFGTVTVINGPAYDAQPDHLRAGVTVPDACWSFIVRGELAGPGVIAFMIPNKGTPTGPLSRYLVSPAEIEKTTGLDLFAGQPQQVRERNEGRKWDRLWN